MQQGAGNWGAGNRELCRWRWFGGRGEVVVLLALASITAVAGCRRGTQADYAKYIPAEATAQQALEAALTAWKDGKPPGPIDGTKPPVQVFDSHRRPKQLLKDFQVLGLAPTGDGPKAFDVRLVLENPHQELKVRFIVLGLDPLLVFTQDDYEMMAHWDHHMDPVDLAGSKPKN
jgi:hypothetical protein